MDEQGEETRVIAVRVPRDFYRLMRAVGAEHDLDNRQVIMWALSLLPRDAAEGGHHVER